MADLFPIFTVHCFTCTQLVRAATPADAHDAMERHYNADHTRLISALVANVTVGAAR